MKPRLLSNRPPTGARLKLDLRRLVGVAPHEGVHWYRDDGRKLAVCVAREPFEGVAGVADGKLRVHISVSCPDRYPSWDELVAVKRAFAEHLTMAIYFPPEAEYVNVHENCFHLWESS